MRRIARHIFTFTLLTLAPRFAFAQSTPPSVFDVRRNIPLSDTAPIYRDYYLTGGSSSGLRANTVVTAYRKLALRDAGGSQVLGEINVPVAQLRVLFVNDKVAVARELKAADRERVPMLEQPWVLVGDLIETKGAVAFREPVVDSLSAGITPSTSTTAAPASSPAAPPSIASGASVEAQLPSTRTSDESSNPPPQPPKAEAQRAPSASRGDLAPPPTAPAQTTPSTSQNPSQAPLRNSTSGA